MKEVDSKRGASIYTPLMLKVYDSYVLGLSNTFVWECPTKQVLLPFFQRHMGQRHLDVGVGTGYYLANTQIQATNEITLLDLNQNSLNATAKRVAAWRPSCIQHDIFKPLTLPSNSKFDSISLFYLLHCLPGTFAEKEQAISNLKLLLAPTGILYGATILGDSSNHNLMGRFLMKAYNKKGIFSNRADTLPTLRSMLENNFEEVVIEQSGKVALFVAKCK
jgi:ubiquinone/menaquinone biosynthesis C-methylase UbiE